MESFRPQKSPGSDRFLGLFSSPSNSSPAASPLELHEDDVFWSGSDPTIPDPTRSPRRPSTPPAMPTAIPNPNPSPLSAASGSFRRLGILAALPEDDKRRSLLQRKPSISTSSAASSASTSPSSRTMMIPSIPKPKTDSFSLSVPAGKIHHQSAPVNVPVAPPATGRTAMMRGNLEEVDGGDDDDEDDEMLPPHEIVARAHGRGSPMTTFSVLEGAGRTLKGRDLRRVRNAVFRQTGFLD